MCVALAFIAASTTSLDARLKDDASELGYELGLPAEDLSGRCTDVAAVSTQRDTRNEALDIGLAEVGISASRAGLGTVEAAVDACSQNADFHSKRPRMCLEDPLSVGHGPSSFEPPRCSRARSIARSVWRISRVGVETARTLSRGRARRDLVTAAWIGTKGPAPAGPFVVCGASVADPTTPVEEATSAAESAEGT
jgi:hypothetical protein